MDQKQKSGWIFWTALALAVLFVVYPLSVGPFVLACDFLIVNGWVTLERYSDIVTGIYAPIIALVAEGPAPVSKAIYRYGEFWAELIPGGL